MSKYELTPEFLSQKTWDLYQTFGVPIEVSLDILEKKGLKLNQKLLEELIQEHQKLSQTTSAGQFKSGLGSDTAKTRRLHTTTHILHQCLIDILGNEVKQTGSAITDQKARFDFTSNNKLSEEQLEELSQKVQSIIDKSLEMTKIETTPEEAKSMGAIGLFGEKYGEKVTVFTLQDENGKVYSREFCSGPHVKNSKEIGKFKILKQKSVGAGVKRIEFDVE
jgi:alanyl-tRNA synthetase